MLHLMSSAYASDLQLLLSESFAVPAFSSSSSLMFGLISVLNRTVLCSSCTPGIAAGGHKTSGAKSNLDHNLENPRSQQTLS